MRDAMRCDAMQQVDGSFACAHTDTDTHDHRRGSGAPARHHTIAATIKKRFHPTAKLNSYTSIRCSSAARPSVRLLVDDFRVVGK